MSMFARFAALTDQEWLTLLLRSVHERVIDGVPMPGFPEEDIQRNFVGSAGEHSLREAFNFYVIVKEYGSRLGCPLGADLRLLDFGCGWGRILRFFLKDCNPANLWGVDVDPEILATSAEVLGCCKFTAVNPLPPTSFEDGYFDIVIAYSVFSHLAEHASIRWLQEFSRLLRPGGMLVATTQGRDFIEFCRSLRGHEQTFAWHKALAHSFVDTEAAYAAYDAGEYLFSATGGGSFRPPDFYGEALIPEGYVRTRWTDFLGFVDFVDDRNVLPQALIVMQKQ